MRKLVWAAIGIGVLFLGTAGATPDEDGDEGLEPSPGHFAADVEYRSIGTLEVGSATFDAFQRADWTPTDDFSIEGAFLYVLRGDDPYAYRIDDDALVGEDDATVHATSIFFLSLEETSETIGAEAGDPEDPDAPDDPDAGDRDGDEDAPVTIVTTSIRTGPRLYVRNEAATLDGARSLVERAEAAAEDWAGVARQAALPREPAGGDEERLRWRTVARSLETLRAKHPDHLGILRDLILAYSRLLPLELGSMTATTLALLIPQRLREWEESCGAPAPAEASLRRGVEASLAFHTGVYPRVQDLALEDEEDEAVGSLVGALQALGYEAFEPLEERTVEGEGPTYLVTPIRATGGPSLPRVDFHRVTFLVRPQDVEGPGTVTFLLAERVLTEEPARTRWALYSSILGTRRLVRLYGEAAPDLDDVTEQVVALVREALVRPEEAR